MGEQMSWLTVKLLAYVSGSLLVACLLLTAAWRLEVAAHKGTKATFVAEQATAAREFAEAAREAEQEQAKKYAEVEARHQQELSDARKAGERVAAELRNGSLRLRDEWAGCETDKRVSEAAASASRDADRARLRIAGAQRLVQLGAECDARIRALQGLK
jgi:hypothetical protein